MHNYTYLKNKMYPSQKQHRSVDMKIVKNDIFKLLKDALGFGQLCAVIGVTFGKQQCDCVYQEIIIFSETCHANW